MYWGLVIFILLIIEIICTIKYCSNGLSSIKIYIFQLSNKYIGFISPKKNYKHSIKNTQNINKTINKSGNKNPRSCEREHSTISENNILKMEKEIQKQCQIEKCIILSKYKKTSRKLILRKDLFYMSKHNEKETSKGL